MSNAPVQPGDLIAQKYRIERLLGEGGMGAVFAARHLQLDQLVAIKFLLTRDAGDEATRRFRREARAAARIRSEHVCRVLDVGELDAGTPYMVMEYLEGCDLADELARRQRLPVAEAAGLVLQACEALAEAHLAGIVHRDIKPGNLFLSQRPLGPPILKVLDFGISKMVDPGVGLALTSTLMQMGSPLYMSPEQIDSSKDVDARTDIWSLGVVLYELVTGRPPYVANTMPQLIHAMMHSEPPRLAELGVAAADDFEALLLRTLQRDRQLRIGSVAELAAELVTYAAGNDRGTAARIAALASASTLVDSARPRESEHASDTMPGGSWAATEALSSGKVSATPVQWERPAEKYKSRRWPSLATGALAACALMGVAYWLGSREISSEGRAPHPAKVQRLDSASMHGTSPGALLAETVPTPTVQAASVDAAVPQGAPTAEAVPVHREIPTTAAPLRKPSRASGSAPRLARTPTSAKEPAGQAPASAPPTAATAVGDELPDFGGRR